VHPDDVAEYVAAQVELLRERLTSRGDLGVLDIALEEHTRLDIRFEKSERQLVKQAVSSQLVGPSGEGVQALYEVPDLGSVPNRRELILRLSCEDFDSQPPTAELLDATAEPLPAGKWPREMAGGGIINGHPHYKRPFFCRPGLREFHTHPEHEDQPWDLFREQLALPEIAIPLLSDLVKRWSFSR
jgi:hypothetical protein